MDEMADVRRVVFKLLARREYSEVELHRKLIQKGYAEEIIAGVLADFKQRNWQSDIRFAECFISYRVQQGFGPLKIQLELSEKGVREAIIDEALQTAEVDWQSELQALYQRRFAKKGPVSNYKTWAQRAQFLQRRGFSTEDICRVLPAPAQDSDELLEDNFIEN